MAEGLMADLVLEGGGVKGIAHIGAATVLEEHGYSFHRVAGTSAGSVAAAFIAAYSKDENHHVRDVVDLMTPGKTANSIDYSKVPGGKIPIPGVEQGREIVSLLANEGMFTGDYLSNWIHQRLRDVGIATFADLCFDGTSQRSDLGDNAAYRLVVMVADISRSSLVRLPWDYPLYGFQRQDQYVADAVRASTSIPFFFQPVKFPWAKPSRNVSFWVDGGAVSDFPIEVFDRTDGQAPRWPTFGIKLQACPAPDSLLNNVSDIVSFARSLLETCVNGNDHVHLADPSVRRRTIFIDTSFVDSENFDLSSLQQQQLFDAGRQAAEDFLKTWDWTEYQAQFPSNSEKAKGARGF